MLISSVRSNPEITILIVVARLAALALRRVRTAARLNGQNAHTPYTARGRYLVLDVAQTVGRILGAHGACEQSREDNKKNKEKVEATRISTRNVHALLHIVASDARKREARYGENDNSEQASNN